MLTYLGESKFLMTNLGELKRIEITEPEGTYFLWMDFRKTGRDHPKDLLSRGLELSDGVHFGGEGFLRMNLLAPAPFWGGMWNNYGFVRLTKRFHLAKIEGFKMGNYSEVIKEAD